MRRSGTTSPKADLVDGSVQACGHVDQCGPLTSSRALSLTGMQGKRLEAPALPQPSRVQQLHVRRSIAAPAHVETTGRVRAHEEIGERAKTKSNSMSERMAETRKAAQKSNSREQSVIPAHAAAAQPASHAHYCPRSSQLAPQLSPQLKPQLSPTLRLKRMLTFR